ncbi:hypothetical protein AB3662_43360 [Sorangium cellulosum]|uniref:hypothetical protein n=1 Tax=Sorangium cellulosum TaxID=56 RepID=UPI003D9A7AAE
MRLLGRVSRLAALGLMLGGTTGCIFPYECDDGLSVAPGEAAPGGIDPVPALAALMPQTLPLRWVRIDQTTTLKLTTATTNMPSTAQLECDGELMSYTVPAAITLQTTDGRLSARAETSVGVDLNGALFRPQRVAANVPASIFADAGVVSPEILDPVTSSGVRFVRVEFELVAAGAGVAYGNGSLVLTGGEIVTLAVVEVSP